MMPTTDPLILLLIVIIVLTVFYYYRSINTTRQRFKQVQIHKKRLKKVLESKSLSNAQNAAG